MIHTKFLKNASQVILKCAHCNLSLKNTTHLYIAILSHYKRNGYHIFAGGLLVLDSAFMPETFLIVANNHFPHLLCCWLESFKSFSRITNHGQKGLPTCFSRWTVNVVNQPWILYFRRSFSVAISAFISAIISASSFSHSPSLCA